MDTSYSREIDLMDESLFPRDSIFLAKENPKGAISNPIPRAAKTNDEIIKAVSEEMADTLGAELEP